MAQKEKGRRRANGLALPQITKSLDSFGMTNTAPEMSRQEGFNPAVWITRRVPVSLIVARHIAELNGLGEARS